MENNEIKVKINGGYLIAGRNIDPDYDGIWVVFQTDDGDIIDVAVIESKAENKKNKIDVYCFEDVHNEDFTHKYTLDVKQIYGALYG